MNYYFYVVEIVDGENVKRQSGILETEVESSKDVFAMFLAGLQKETNNKVFISAFNKV